MIRHVQWLLPAALLLAASMPAAASAGSLVRAADTRTSMFCELEGEAGTVHVFVEASDEWGTFGDVALWSGEATGIPDYVTWAAEVAVTPAGATGSFELIALDENGEPLSEEPAGTATLLASFSPHGEPEPYSVVDRDGNRVAHREGVIQQLAVSGTLEIDLVEGTDGPYSLAGCSASTDTATIAMNDPRSYVSGDQRLSLWCVWSTEDATVFLFAGSDPWGAFSDLHVEHGEDSTHGFADATFTDSGFEAEYELWGPSGSEGTASASATLTRTREAIRIHDRLGNFKYNEVGWELAVDGALTLDLGGGETTLAMDDESCTASDTRVQVIRSRPSGPRLRNDAPSGAVALQPGSTVEVRTGGTSDEPEAPCGDVDDDHVHDLPITNTAWWTFTGTGDEVTVDTAGSDFDTIVGLYVVEGDELVQVGCVDDVFDPETGEGTLQAVITADTVAGTTYYVQAGGFGGSVGRLVLRVE